MTQLKARLVRVGAALAAIPMTATFAMAGCGSDDDSSNAGGSGGTADASTGGLSGTGGSTGGTAGSTGGTGGGSGGATGGSSGSSGASGSGGAAGTDGGAGAGGSDAGTDGSAGTGGPDGGAGTGGGDAAADAPTDAVSCDDGNAATKDFLHPTYGCAHKFDAVPADGEAWITYDIGFSVDLKTKMGWSPVMSNKAYATFAPFCAALSIAGLSNWRFATIDDLRTLAGGCAPPMTGGSCTISDPGCLQKSCGIGSTCTSCIGGGGPNNGKYCKVDVQGCSTMWSSSLCPDCAPANAPWAYGTTNGNFHPQSTALFHGRCVSSSVPNPE